MWGIRKTVASAGAVVVCAAALAACNDDTTASPSASSSASSASASGSSAPPSAPATPSSPATSAPGAVPGSAQLKALLPTASTAPSGWKVEADEESDSDGAAQDPGDPELPTDDCNDAMTGGQPQDLTSDYSAAFASIPLTDPQLGESYVVFNSYQPGDAVKQMADVRAVARRCASYTGKAGSGKSIKITTSVTTVPGLGDDAFELKVTPKGDYVGNDTILVRSGDTVMAVDEDLATGQPFPLAPIAKHLAAPMLKS